MFKSTTFFQYNKNCQFCMYPSFTLNESKILKRLTKGRVIVLNTVRSTNQYIMDNLKYIQTGDVFVTDHQTHGRGRYGKYWITPDSQGIALSMYWKINKKLLIKTELGVMISFAVAKVLKKLGVSQIKIKWPNDLYVYDRKLAGILIEIITNSNVNYCLIIGIGINVSICTCTKLTMMNISNNWIDLKSIGICLDYNVLVVKLVKELYIVMEQFLYNRYKLFNTYYSKELDYLYNQPVAVLYNNCIYHGISIGIHEGGMLLVLDRSGVVHRYYLEDNLSICRV